MNRTIKAAVTQRDRGSRRLRSSPRRRRGRHPRTGTRPSSSTAPSGSRSPSGRRIKTLEIALRRRHSSLLPARPMRCPILRSEALKASSYKVHIVSGVTFTSEAFVASLYTRWATSTSRDRLPTPNHGPMSSIAHSALGAPERLPPSRDGIRRHVEYVMGMPVDVRSLRPGHRPGTGPAGDQLAALGRRDLLDLPGGQRDQPSQSRPARSRRSASRRRSDPRGLPAAAPGNRRLLRHPRAVRRRRRRPGGRPRAARISRSVRPRQGVGGRRRGRPHPCRRGTQLRGQRRR